MSKIWEDPFFSNQATLMTEKGTLCSVKQLWSWSMDALLLHFLKESPAIELDQGRHCRPPGCMC